MKKGVLMAATVLSVGCSDKNEPIKDSVRELDNPLDLAMLDCSNKYDSPVSQEKCVQLAGFKIEGKYHVKEVNAYFEEYSELEYSEDEVMIIKASTLKSIVRLRDDCLLAQSNRTEGECVDWATSSMLLGIEKEIEDDLYDEGDKKEFLYSYFYLLDLWLNNI